MDGWVDGWMDGHKSHFKDCIQQLKNSGKSRFLPDLNDGLSVLS